jgi:hypothetical protein
MPTTYLKNVPIEHGEMTMVLGKSAEEVMQHAWRLAVECQQLGVGVMLINTGISKRRFTLADPRPHTGEKYRAQLMVHTSNRGDLVGEEEEIAQIVRDCKIGVVIIASWEWSASNYTRMRRLQFMLRGLMEDFDIAVLVYSQAARKAVAGCMDRGGTGRLEIMVIAISELRGVDQSAEASPKPKPHVTHSNAERQAMQATVNEATQLLASEIRGLDRDVGEGHKKSGPMGRFPVGAANRT